MSRRGCALSLTFICSAAIAHACSCCAWLPLARPQVFTQVSLILLLYGTLCGGLAFLSDVARVMVMQVGGRAAGGASVGGRGCRAPCGTCTHPHLWGVSDGGRTCSR